MSKGKNLDGRALDAEDGEDVADAGVAEVGRPDGVLDALNDVLGGVEVLDAVGDGLGQADGALGAIAL